MSSNRQCIFCWRRSGDGVQPSREHLLSRPVASAFGIGRESPFLLMNGDLSDQQWRVLNGISRRCVCHDCNTGWMRRLEEAMPAVADWLAGSSDAPIGDDRALLLRKWSLKTHLLLCFMQGMADNWGDDAFPQAVVPPMTVARELLENDTSAIQDASVGIARSGASTEFAFLFGHPGMKQTGRGTWDATTAPTSIITVGDQQVWVITPIVSADIETTAGVLPINPGLAPCDLATLGHPMNLERCVVVDYGADLDAAAMVGALQEWAAQLEE
jgi:hypothetical protein